MITPVLTAELLALLEGHMRTHQPLFLERLEPGPTEATVREALDSLGLVATDEALTWLTWRTPSSTKITKIGTFHVLGLNEGIARRRFLRSLDEDEGVGLTEVNESWPANCLPILAAGSTTIGLVLDGGTVSTVIGISAHDSVYPHPSVPSLGTVVTWWLEFFDQGFYNADGGFSGPFEAIPADRMRFVL